jgi:flagellar hook-associated protein 1 FlgK
MSLPDAINAAQSGLAASQTLSRVAAENVSNAMTPGYVRRDAVLTSRGGAGGVVVAEFRRDVDAALTRVARQETGKMTRHQAVYEGLRNYTAFLGQPSDDISPASRFSDFSNAMTTLVNLPSSNGAQLGAVVAAEELAASIRGAHNFLAEVRAEVDMEIRYEVSDLNQNLHRIAELNPLATQLQSNTLDAINYQDQIDRIIDEIAQTAEVRITKTSDGWVNVYTATGAALLEGDIVSDVTYNPGTGDFFAANQEITPGKDGLHGIENGSLMGFSELRNEILPRFQLQLDEYSRALVQSFESADSSLSATQAGLFTDAGSRFDASNLDGLAGRLTVNQLVQVTKDAEVWRIRDGLGVATEGDASDTQQIQTFIATFEAEVSVVSQAGLGANIRLGGLAAAVVASQHSERARAETLFNSATSAAEVVEASRRSAEGVSIDDEMIRLSMIEQSYAANSKLLKTLMEMFDTLLDAVR